MKTWTDIEGWFTKADALIFDIWAQYCPDSCVIAELGTYNGKSTRALVAALAKAGKKNVYIYSIDTFPHNTLNVASANLVGHQDRVRLVQTTFTRASRLFDDGELWALYIDGSHDESGLREIIKQWVPKVVSHGVVGGHDYSSKWPEVVKVVNELSPNPPGVFGTSFQIQRKNLIVPETW